MHPTKFGGFFTALSYTVALLFMEKVFTEIIKITHWFIFLYPRYVFVGEGNLGLLYKWGDVFRQINVMKTGGLAGF